MARKKKLDDAGEGFLLGVLFSAWLTYLEIGVIHAICIWCVTSAVIVTVIFLVSLADLREARRAGLETG